MPASQYISNAKMKPDENRDHVEFAIKLQNDVMCPIDSHWPIEKYKAIDEAFQEKDKNALAKARHDLALAFKNKSKNVVIGFGLTEKTIKSLKKADGLVVGSAICKEISKSIERRQNTVTNVTYIVKRLRNKIQ